jgi:histone chaperone ASF1
MSLVNITNIVIDNNPAPFLDKFKLHITFECIEDIPEEIGKLYILKIIDWEFLYVGSAKDESKDIIID